MGSSQYAQRVVEAKTAIGGPTNVHSTSTRVPAGPDHLPPGPRQPVLAQTLRYVRDPFTFLERCQERYAVDGAATINILGFGRTVWVTSPELIHEVFARDDEMPLSPAGNLVKPIFGTRSVTGLDGHPHLQRRKLLLPASTVSAWVLSRPASIALRAPHRALGAGLRVRAPSGDVPADHGLPLRDADRSHGS